MGQDNPCFRTQGSKANQEDDMTLEGEEQALDACCLSEGQPSMTTEHQVAFLQGWSSLSSSSFPSSSSAHNMYQHKHKMEH